MTEVIGEVLPNHPAGVLDRVLEVGGRIERLIEQLPWEIVAVDVVGDDLVGHLLAARP